MLESPPARGAVAQLGERRVRNAKVEGSIPFRSTMNRSNFVSMARFIACEKRRPCEHSGTTLLMCRALPMPPSVLVINLLSGPPLGPQIDPRAPVIIVLRAAHGAQVAPGTLGGLTH